MKKDSYINFEMKGSIAQEFNKFFETKKIVNNLTLAALYLTLFETLKKIIISNIVFSMYDKNQVSTELQKFYLKKANGKIKKDKFLASLKWLKEIEAINEIDVAAIIKIRNHRNKIAHELMQFLIDPQIEIDTGLMVQIKHYIEIIERWWIRNVYLQYNQDYDQKEIMHDDLHSSRMICINHVFNAIF